jgi:hypothetical protein
MSIATQMTGMNAIMNYAPQIMASAGLQPMAGNLMVMVWNFLTSAVSIPINQKTTERPTYLTAVSVAICAALLTGIPTFPGLLDHTTKSILASIGIAVFIACFEIGIGCLFFVLATQLFPPAFAETGCAITNTVNLSFNLVINFGYPVAVEALSGGPSGNQDLGMAKVFCIFAGLGIISVAYLFRFLHPWKIREEESSDALLASARLQCD